MKVKYDPEATYVLCDYSDGDAIRIICEANNTSILNCDGEQLESSEVFPPNLNTIKNLVGIGYTVIQEWK